jgi:transcriptional regulator with XRE-family HTH domain
MDVSETWEKQRKALGTYLRGQRKLADLSLRELSRLTDVSNPYLSQIERGLHQPSVRVLKSLAEALDISAETLLAQAGFLDEQADIEPSTERAIRSDPRLAPEQQEALIAVYRSYVAQSPSDDAPG